MITTEEMLMRERELRMEVEYWRRRYEEVGRQLVETVSLASHQPMRMLAHGESYEAGRIRGQKDLAEHLREDIAKLVEAMGMEGYGTLAIAQAIRKGKAA